MNLYLISQDENNDYDTYDSAVVCAQNEQEARMIQPNGTGKEFNTGDFGTWAKYPDQVKVTLIGVADSSIAEGLVLASFNAG